MLNKYVVLTDRGQMYRITAATRKEAWKTASILTQDKILYCKKEK